MMMLVVVLAGFAGDYDDVCDEDGEENEVRKRGESRNSDAFSI